MSPIRGLNYSMRSSASHSPGALQSAQISVDGRSFILEDIFQTIKVLKTKQPCLLEANRSMNLYFLFPLHCVFDSQDRRFTRKKITLAYFWSALKESVMRYGYRLSSLIGRHPLGRSSKRAEEFPTTRVLCAIRRCGYRYTLFFNRSPEKSHGVYISLVIFFNQPVMYTVLFV